MGDYYFVVGILGVHASQACLAFFMQSFALDLSGNCLGGATSRESYEFVVCGDGITLQRVW